MSFVNILYCRKVSVAYEDIRKLKINRKISKGDIAWNCRREEVIWVDLYIKPDMCLAIMSNFGAEMLISSTALHGNNSIDIFRR